jgi:CIC family chloride channel protein
MPPEDQPNRVSQWAEKIVELRHLTFIAIPVGALAGGGVSGLEAICNSLLWGHLGAAPAALRLLWPIVGLLLSGYILSVLHLRSVGMLNEVVVHYHQPPEQLSPREDALKMGACVATVGFGASAGLGGPSQWLGARIALYFVRHGQCFRVIRGLTDQHAVLIGAAAGVSAIFRAPLTGTLLALETPFSKDLDATALLPASIAALVAHVVHGLLADNSPLLPFPIDAGHSLPAILSAGALGIIAGLTSRRFQRIMFWTRTTTGRLPWPTRALLGAVVTSATAAIAWWAFGETWTLQAGLPLGHAVFDGRFLGGAALALLGLKLVAVWATFGTSGVAGLLVVTLTVGTLIGGACHPLLSGLGPQAACAIAVCAYLAANYNAPLTGIALAAEWGGTSLLSVAWVAVLIAAWIGEGLANTPAKVGTRHSGDIAHH